MYALKYEVTERSFHPTQLFEMMEIMSRVTAEVQLASKKLAGYAQVVHQFQKTPELIFELTVKSTQLLLLFEMMEIRSTATDVVLHEVLKLGGLVREALQQPKILVLKSEAMVSGSI